MNTFVNIVLTLIIVCTFAAGFAGAASIGLDRQARSQCVEWQRAADQTPGAMIRQWQKAQCDFYHVSINAQVRD